MRLKQIEKKHKSIVVWPELKPKSRTKKMSANAFILLQET